METKAMANYTHDLIFQFLFCYILLFLYFYFDRYIASLILIVDKQVGDIGINKGMIGNLQDLDWWCLFYWRQLAIMSFILKNKQIENVSDSKSKNKHSFDTFSE